MTTEILNTGSSEDNLILYYKTKLSILSCNLNFRINRAYLLCRNITKGQTYLMGAYFKDKTTKTLYCLKSFQTIMMTTHLLLRLSMIQASSLQRVEREEQKNQILNVQIVGSSLPTIQT